MRPPSGVQRRTPPALQAVARLAVVALRAPSQLPWRRRLPRARQYPSRCADGASLGASVHRSRQPASRLWCCRPAPRTAPRRSVTPHGPPWPLLMPAYAGAPPGGAAAIAAAEAPAAQPASRPHRRRAAAPVQLPAGHAAPALRGHPPSGRRRARGRCPTSAAPRAQQPPGPAAAGRTRTARDARREARPLRGWSLQKAHDHLPSLAKGAAGGSAPSCSGPHWKAGQQRLRWQAAAMG
mmetsp:Transcript_145021/g.403955  ORF Transcript_145021/g.403955 Transcript_145021/m.403955 type:complete len:238 (+) Transcript_145021:213-926(+)